MMFQYSGIPSWKEKIIFKRKYPFGKKKKLHLKNLILQNVNDHRTKQYMGKQTNALFIFIHGTTQ